MGLANLRGNVERDGHSWSRIWGFVLAVQCLTLEVRYERRVVTETSLVVVVIDLPNLRI